MSATTMRAWLASPDGPRFVEVPRPVAGPGQVLVRVRAAAVNRADLNMLHGASHGAIGGAGVPLGLEWAGEIVAVGDGVTDCGPGDRVAGAGAGAFAEFVLGRSGLVLPVPRTVDFAAAATVPVALQTMHDAVVTHGRLQGGQSILILGAASATGLMGLKVARERGAGLIAGSSTSPGKRARLAALGADLMVDTGDPGWVDAILSATDGQGVDVVVDHLAGPVFNDAMRATRIGGRIVNVGRMAGATAAVDFDLHALRRITWAGVTFRTRSGREIAGIVQRAREDLGAALADGRLALPIDSVFDLADAPAAFAKMVANRHFGKIVLTLD